MNTNIIQQTIAIVAIPSLIITILTILCQWRILSKAGKPGWFSIIPVLNIISFYQVACALKFLLMQIVGSVIFFIICNIKGDIFVIGSFICLFVIIISSLALSFKLAKKFNKGILFGIVLMFLPIIGYPMLAFGKSQYVRKAEHQEDIEEDDQEIPQEDNQEIQEEEEDLSEFTNENYVQEEENIDSTTEEESPEIEDLDDKDFIDPPVTIQDEEPEVVDIDNEEDNSIEEENDAVDTIEQEEIDEDNEQQDEDSELETKEIDF